MAARPTKNYHVTLPAGEVPDGPLRLHRPGIASYELTVADGRVVTDDPDTARALAARYPRATVVAPTTAEGDLGDPAGGDAGTSA